MLAAAIIFSPFFFHFVETCLKINYSTPPKCECKSLALDSSNMQQNIGTSSFYPNISLHSVQSPIISIDDCALAAHCNNENYDLVGFDPLKATMFGKYNAEGFCDPYTQKWLIDDGDGSGLTTYPQFFGICVDYLSRCTDCSAFNIYNSYGTENSISFATAYLYT
ncbi:hypothetical protein CRE_17483 [Caenorhabditis remanei]|uniref:DUF281 domain-containing protein n=1 Tax=Caenorhabditis remanei TaxID=31234 RepID=E3N7U4_CAERE|nr:hypothetical protein CRE_17483 [Caenorhabditis remanei]